MFSQLSRSAIANVFNQTYSPMS